MRSRTRLRYRGLYAGSASWSPASLSGLEIWLTAGPTWCFTDAGGTTPAGDGDSVYVWKDRSGNAHDFSQAPSGYRPTLRLVSGKWVVRFDGTDDAIEGGNLSAAFPSAGTCAIRYILNDNDDTVVLGTDGNDARDRGFNGSTYESLAGQFRSARATSGAAVPQGAWATFLVRSSASAWTRRDNGVQTVSKTAAYRGGTGWFVGGNYAGTGGARPMNGDVAGVVAYSSAVSDDDAEAIETYLATLSP